MANARASTITAWLVLGPLFLAAGVWIGQLLPPMGDKQRVWSGPEGDAPAARAPAAVLGLPSLAPVVERVAPGVVTVQALLPLEASEAEAQDKPGASRGVRNGSGFVVNAEGLVVTSRHVVVDASSVLVRVPGHRPCSAVLVGSDFVTDLAVLRLEDPPPGLRALELGRSELLRAGDWIVTVGNPFDFSQTVTAGVVSFVGRHLPHYDLHVTNDFLQFSAPVNPGSSGSPVVDLEGRVVGVTTQAAESAQNISFAIPSHTLKWVLDALENSPDHRVHRGFLGIRFAQRTGTDDYGRRLEGAVITVVAKGEPAHRAGLRPRDIVLYCNDHKLSDAGDLHARITRGTPGSSMRLTILRDGRVLEPIEVTLGELKVPGENGLNQ